MPSSFVLSTIPSVVRPVERVGQDHGLTERPPATMPTSKSAGPSRLGTPSGPVLSSELADGCNGNGEVAERVDPPRALLGGASTTDAAEIFGPVLAGAMP